MGVAVEVSLKIVAAWATDNLIKCIGVAHSFQVFFNCIHSWGPEINNALRGVELYHPLGKHRPDYC